MFTNKLLPWLIFVGLLTSCAIDTPLSSTPKPSSRPIHTEISVTPSASKTPETPTVQATPDAPSTKERPPAVEDMSTPAPVETARADLAQRLHTDVARIEVIDVTAREPDIEDMPCLADKPTFEKLGESVEEIQWITLSVKDNIYHYVAWGDQVIYCEEK